jgi:hypothetical protein
MLNGLAPWRSPTASTAPYSLDGVLLPAYPALPVLPACAAYAACAACAACGLALFFHSVICVSTWLNSCYFVHICNRTVCLRLTRGVARDTLVDRRA